MKSKEMMNQPDPLRSVLSFVFLVVFVFFIVSSTEFAFRNLGLDQSAAFLLLTLAIFGSAVNIPLFKIRSEGILTYERVGLLWGSWELPIYRPPQTTEVFINIGGALVPVLLSGTLLVLNPSLLVPVLVTIVPMTLITHKIAKIIPGLGITIPMFLILFIGLGVSISVEALYFLMGAPLSVIELAIVAYTSVTIGTLVGADLLNLPKVDKMQSSKVSIGGAGIFDGVFLAGLLVLVFLI